jgi:uncharacterized protein RhaS with RHS repeats
MWGNFFWACPRAPKHPPRRLRAPEEGEPGARGRVFRYYGPALGLSLRIAATSGRAIPLHPLTRADRFGRQVGINLYRFG